MRAWPLLPKEARLPHPLFDLILERVDPPEGMSRAEVPDVRLLHDLVGLDAPAEVVPARQLVPGHVAGGEEGGEEALVPAVV